MEISLDFPRLDRRKRLREDEREPKQGLFAQGGANDEGQGKSPTRPRFFSVEPYSLEMRLRP